MTELEEYYNKFNEEKRLTRRHGMVEFITSMKYIHECLEKIASGKTVGGNTGKEEALEENESVMEKGQIRILDVGAGTGRYSVALAEEGYDVTAVELVKHNLGVLKAKGSSVKAYQGTALKLTRFADDSFDVTLIFGPMYHLFTFEDKQKAMEEAKRVTKPGGYILVAYCMNEYSVLTYAFKENHLQECMEQGRLSDDFHTLAEPKDLYDYVRIEDINRLAEAADLTRVKLVAADGPANYMRPVLNAMDDATFDQFIRYHLTTCERPELLGASAHTLDILRKNSKNPLEQCPHKRLYEEQLCEECKWKVEAYKLQPVR